MAFQQFQMPVTIYSLIEFDCPDDGTCSNQGTCDDTTGICECFLGYKGNICQGNCVLFCSI